ncbi:MAG: hypothetical protein RLZZ156_756 [Deinococcota bacterium]|jgi:hypothetical protein
MAYQIWKREHHKHLKAKRWLPSPYGWYFRLRSREQQTQLMSNWEFEDQYNHNLQAIKKRQLNTSVYFGKCKFSSQFFHPIWRRAGKQICQLHLQSLHDQADNLDPQPKRLGILWYID